MIYLQKTDNELVIPKHYELGSDISMTLINNLGHQVVEFTNLVNVSENDYYYKFEISVSDLATGEYNCTVKCGAFPVYEGMITVGDYTRISNEYQQNHTFIQYGE